MTCLAWSPIVTDLVISGKRILYIYALKKFSEWKSSLEIGNIVI